MIVDPERFPAYAAAISRAVRPGDVVLDLGCGPGYFALLACHAGAGRVFAIDTADVIHLGRELAISNGFADRIEFFQSDSRRLELAERANVIVSDVRGLLPLFDHAISIINDARARFLAPGGILIPRRDLLKAALVEAADFHLRLTRPWQTAIPSLDLTPSLRFVLNQVHAAQFGLQELLTEPKTACLLDYEASLSTSLDCELDFTITRSGTARGICLWFDAQLLEEIGYSTGPGAEDSISGQLFLPWLEPIRVQPDQTIRVRLQAPLIGDEYVWCWETRISAHDGQPARHFVQSMLEGAILSPASLRRRAADFIPALSGSGEAERFILDAIDGKTTLQQIAEATAAHFPAVFPRWEDAMRRAADLAAQFSR